MAVETCYIIIIIILLLLLLFLFRNKLFTIIVTVPGNDISQ